jgi:ABC-type branched-subunit amino acid transport system substrate-binding protein
VASTREPTRLGVLYDFPQGDGGAGFESALRLGLSRASDRVGGSIELLPLEVGGLPAGSGTEVRDGFATLERAGVAAVVGPSISDNALVVTPLADAAGIPCVNYTGGERTRSAWMFHYQVGSLEEEPLFLAERMVERSLARAAVVYDESVVGRRYHECFAAAARRSGLEITAAVALPPLTTDAHDALAALRRDDPDALAYLGLGVSSRAVALGLAAAGWPVPVLANSALMFGYARPDWRDGYRGWEYIDTIADDNPQREALRALDPRAAAGPIGCAAYDIGRLVGEALASLVADASVTRDGVRTALESVKALPAASGAAGTRMGFGVYDHGALKGPFLVLREWRDGRSVQVARP